MWELLQQPPQGLSVDFVRAERSSFRWEGGVVENLQALGHRVHLLRDAGHVVHQDNPGKQDRERPPGHSLEWVVFVAAVVHHFFACKQPSMMVGTCLGCGWQKVPSHLLMPLLVLTLLLCIACAGGLFDIMSPSFGTVDLHLERAKAGVRRR